MLTLTSTENIWLTADTHLGHDKIRKHCKRPFKSAKEMDDVLMDNWNSRINKDNLVIHLGDMSFKSDQYVNRLNGNILLIKGNHDNKKYDNLFYGAAKFLYVKLGPYICFLRHRPVILDRAQSNKVWLEQEQKVLDTSHFVIHGHVHGGFVYSGKNLNVGVDAWDFKPVHISQLMNLMRNIFPK